MYENYEGREFAFLSFSERFITSTQRFVSIAFDALLSLDLNLFTQTTALRFAIEQPPFVRIHYENLGKFIKTIILAAHITTGFSRRAI